MNSPELPEHSQPRQEFLLDMNDLPVRNDLLAVIRPEYQHTGKRALADERLAMKIVELLHSKWGLKRISQQLRVSKWTVKVFRDELVKQGKLAPFKERLNAVYEEILEVGAENYLEALEDGLVAPAQIPLGHGIFADKKALADGSPTSIVATAKQNEKLSLENINSFFDQLKSAKPPVIDLPPDSESTGNKENPQ